MPRVKQRRRRVPGGGERPRRVRLRACGAILRITRRAAASPASYSAAASRPRSPAFAAPCRMLVTPRAAVDGSVPIVCSTRSCTLSGRSGFRLTRPRRLHSVAVCEVVEALALRPPEYGEELVGEARRLDFLVQRARFWRRAASPSPPERTAKRGGRGSDGRSVSSARTRGGGRRRGCSGKVRGARRAAARQRRHNIQAMAQARSARA